MYLGNKFCSRPGSVYLQFSDPGIQTFDARLYGSIATRLTATPNKLMRLLVRRFALQGFSGLYLSFCAKYGDDIDIPSKIFIVHTLHIKLSTPYILRD